MESLGIEVDDKLLSVLNADEALAKELEKSIQYLEKQDKFISQRIEQQNRDEIYDSVINAFSFISALGQVTGNKSITKISMASIQVTLIHKSLGDISKSSGMALINPYAAMGMAVINLISLFGSKSEDPNKLILDQLRHISRQIENLQQQVTERFEDVHFHLMRIEKMMLHNFQVLNFMINKPLNYRINEIISDIKHSQKLLYRGFQDVLLDDLASSIEIVKSIVNGITPIHTVSVDSVQRLLVNLAAWVKDKSYNQHFSVSGFNQLITDKFTIGKSYKSATEALSCVTDSRFKINVLLGYLQSNGWFAVRVKLPNTIIWLEALKSYLAIRKIYVEKLKVSYDPERREEDEIITLHKSQIAALSELETSKTVAMHMNEKVVSLLNSLENMVSEYRQSTISRFKNHHSLGSVDYPLFEDDVCYREVIGQAVIPKRYKFDYVSGHDTDKRRGRQRDFTEENNFTTAQALELLKQKADRKGIQLFHPVLLIAEQAGLIEFNCKMHRSMTNGGKQTFETEGKMYGLEIELYIKDTQQRILLTKPSQGKAAWSSAHKHTTKTTIEAHKKAIPMKSELLTENIISAVAIVEKIIKAKVETVREGFYMNLASELSKENSLLYELKFHLLMILELGNNCNFHIDQSNVIRLLNRADDLINAAQADRINSELIEESLIGLSESVAKFAEVKPMFEFNKSQNGNCLSDLRSGIELIVSNKNRDYAHKNINRNRYEFFTSPESSKTENTPDLSAQEGLGI